MEKLRPRSRAGTVTVAIVVLIALTALLIAVRIALLDLFQAL